MSLAFDATRSANGQYAPGHSGNPAGRPKGARNKATLLREVLCEGEAEALLRAMIDLAHAGNMAALRFCCERIVGRPRAASVALDLAPGAESDPAALMTAAIRAMADGEIAPAEALVVARVATVARPALRDAEFKRRCEAAGAEARRQEAAQEGAAEAPAQDDPAPADAQESGSAPVIRLYPAPSAEAPPLAADGAEDAAGAAPPVSGLYFGSAAPVPIRRGATPS